MLYMYSSSTCLVDGWMIAIVDENDVLCEYKVSDMRKCYFLSKIQTCRREVHLSIKLLNIRSHRFTPIDFDNYKQ